MRRSSRPFDAHRCCSLCILLAALILKLIVPTGYMPTVTNGTMTISMCTGMGAKSVTIAIPRDADHRTPDRSPGSGTDTQAVCAFAGLGMASLAPTDPLLLALAIAFVLALGLAATPLPPVRRVPRLRPPLRGPPLPA